MTQSERLAKQPCQESTRSSWSFERCQGSSSGSDTFVLWLMCHSCARLRSCADLHQVAGSGLLQRCRNGRWSCYRRRPLKHVPRRRSPHWRAVQHERVGTTRADTHRAACLLSHLCFLSASRLSHDRVSGACAAAVAEVSVAALNFFLRLWRACHWLLLSPAAGLGARFLGSFLWAASFHCSIAADQPGARQRHGA